MSVEYVIRCDHPNCDRVLDSGSRAASKVRADINRLGLGVCPPRVRGDYCLEHSPLGRKS